MQEETSNTALSATREIKLAYQENTNSAFIYNISDWEILRKKYRIIGETFGHTQFVPALPLRLNPEEIVVLVKNCKAILVKYPDLQTPPSEQYRKQVFNFHNKLIGEERAVYTSLRKSELELTAKHIIAGKRKHGDTRTDEAIIDDELKKSARVSEDAIIWPTFTAPIDGIQVENSTPIPFDTIFKYTTETKCLVYEDLWKKGYFITPGQKFGADFLVYSGDPILFHAIYIVKCVEDCNKAIHSSELIAFGRLGTSVKKRAVLASLSIKRTVTYITLNWMDSANNK